MEMMQTIAKWLDAGGVYMYFILAVFAVGIAIVIERCWFYFVTCKSMNAVRAGETAKAIESGTEKQHLEILKKRNDPLSGLMEVALDRYASGADIEDVQEGIDEVAVQEVPRMNERLNYLALIANIATLIGLLGTIDGLQMSFASLGSLEASEKAAALAKGISIFMNSTAFGLIVAIFHMVAYTMLTNKQKQLTKNLDDAMLRLMNFMTKRRKKG